MKATISSGEVFVWPWCPQIPMNESWEWMTEVFTSHNGVDTMSRFRNAPRWTLEVRNVLTHPDYTRAANAMDEGVGKPWVMPVWTERVAAVIGNGVNTVEASSATSDFREGGLILLWESPDKWELAEIVSIVGDTITLDDTTVQGYDGFAIPARLGRVLQMPGSGTNKKYAAWQFTFQSDENYARSPDAPTQFAGHDLDIRCPLLDGDGVADEYMTRVEVMDEMTGLVTTNTPWNQNRRRRAIRTFNENREASWAFREWLHRRAGRYRPFWAPSFTRDLRLVSTGALGTTIDVIDDGYGERQHIAVLTKNGTWLPRTVTGISPVGGDVIRLTLDDSLGIDADEVAQISYLMLYRLSADRIEIQHIGEGRTRATVPVVEIPA